MKCKPGLWLICFFVLTCTILGLIAVKTIQTDPFFHYHKPDTDQYFYILDNERSQNDGIVKHFDYSGLITGTSMVQNFRASEAEALWGCSFIKVPSAGATLKEVNDLLDVALQSNPGLKIIIRSIDTSKVMYDKDSMMGGSDDYPTYLYDDNVFNDVKYIFNRDVVFSRVYSMIKAKGNNGFTGGITSFDDYSKWDYSEFVFGKNALFPNGVSPTDPGEPVYLTEAEAETTRANIRQNVTVLAHRYPDVLFCCFFPPYSAQYWMEKLNDGTIYQQVEAERIVIEELLECGNIKLFSFNNLHGITTDLNHYKDSIHYGEWINSFILQSIHDNYCLITKENYRAYLDEELDFYSTFSYEQMNGQSDYEDDRIAALRLIETENSTEE